VGRFTVAKPIHTFPKKPYVFVLWHDPHSPGATEVFSEEDVHALHRSLPMITAGWLMKEDDDGVSIASEYCGDGDYRGTTFVLKELLIDVIRVRTPTGNTGTKSRKARTRSRKPTVTVETIGQSHAETANTSGESV
jgi:hypothetical protein